MQISDTIRRGDISFWYRDIGIPERRPALSGSRSADVCIIGAGYTGLWTAYYLKKANPGLSVVVLEREFAGFGASGRNGGWLTGGFAWNHERYLSQSGPDAVRQMVRAMEGTVAEVIRVAEAEAIDADILPTDELLVATNPAQMQRLEAELAHRRNWGETRIGMLDQAETRARIAIPGALGAMRIGGVARVQPAKLVRGLAEAVERLGAEIFENTPVTSYGPGQAETPFGRVSAPVILRCTEGFTADMPGHKRDWLPLNSAQIITAPVPDAVWEKIGWQGHEIIGDFANSYCYCQRTREGRIAVGGRGVPYLFGSRIDQDGTPDDETIRRLMAILHRHFPAAADVPVEHAWCGVLGVPRDWCATAGFAPEAGLGHAGGYVGVGVSTSNLAGRTLADLALGRQTDLTDLPWVNRPVRNWEPEPLRWLGVHGMYALYGLADSREPRTGRISRLARLGNWLTGR